VRLLAHSTADSAAHLGGSARPKTPICRAVRTSPHRRQPARLRHGPSATRLARVPSYSLLRTNGEQTRSKPRAGEAFSQTRILPDTGGGSRDLHLMSRAGFRSKGQDDRFRVVPHLRSAMGQEILWCRPSWVRIPPPALFGEPPTFRLTRARRLW